VIPDGQFGNYTEGGLKNLQSFLGMPVTGVCDAASWAALHMINVKSPADYPA